MTPVPTLNPTAPPTHVPTFARTPSLTKAPTKPPTLFLTKYLTFALTFTPNPPPTFPMNLSSTFATTFALTLALSSSCTKTVILIPPAMTSSSWHQMPTVTLQEYWVLRMESKLSIPAPLARPASIVVYSEITHTNHNVSEPFFSICDSTHISGTAST